MKALTLWQPWATLVARGVKTIETRGWSTAYRGPLLIHAAKRSPDLYVQGVVPMWHPDKWTLWFTTEPGKSADHPCPLGAVVATCTLIDVVPIGGPTRCPEVREDTDGLWLYPASGRPAQDVSDQQPYGDFTPGRYAWLLDNVQALPESIPAKGRQGLWSPDADLLATVEVAA